MGVLKLKQIGFIGVLFVTSLACSLSGQPPGPPPDAVFAEADITATSTLLAITSTPTVIHPGTPEVRTPTPIEPEVTTIELSGTMTAQPSESPTAVVTIEATVVVSPTVTPMPSESPTADDIPVRSPLDDAPIKQEDSFSGGGSFVTANIEDRYSIGYTSELFQFEVLLPEIEAWVIRSQVLSNSRQEIDLVSIQGAEDGFFGLICRWERSNSYYRFTISQAGELRITRKFLNVETDLAQIQSQVYVVEDVGLLRLRADCSGTNLLLYVNSDLVLAAEDDEIRSGKVGLMAGTEIGSPLLIEVDNYELYYP